MSLIRHELIELMNLSPEQISFHLSHQQVKAELECCSTGRRVFLCSFHEESLPPAGLTGSEDSL